MYLELQSMGTSPRVHLKFGNKCVCQMEGSQSGTWIQIGTWFMDLDFFVGPGG